MKLLCIHAHFDDFEFVAGGSFELLRRLHPENFRARVLICTDGRAGHQSLSPEETHRRRVAEQQASAEVGGYEFENLRLPDGSVPREACLRVSVELLAALWKSIRAFEPDYIFCPPLATDPLAGMHVDHVAVAQAVREVAYMINVPHAFLPEYPADPAQSRPVKVPVILNTYDHYQFGQTHHDLAINVESQFDLIAREAWCHQSQIMEWLPWVGRHRMPAPKDFEDWKGVLRQRYFIQNRQLGFKSKEAYEVFAVTAWGEVPSFDQIENDFGPLLTRKFCRLKKLRYRLARWRAEPA